MKTIELSAQDVNVIQDIILENNVETFLLSDDDESNEAGRFSAVNLEFEQTINGRIATVIIRVR